MLRFDNTHSHTHRFYRSACSTVKEAGSHLRMAFSREKSFRFKAGKDPVTPVDEEMEHFIIQALRRQFPDHNFLGEEHGFQKGSSSYCWVIDPLDGTMNFLHGDPHFCISLALLDFRQQEILLGIIYQPITDELYTAINHHGAYVNGETLKVSGILEKDACLLGIGFGSSLELRKRQQTLVWQMLSQYGAVRELGSGALTLCAVARGMYEGYCELETHLWDVAAGTLLVAEAGGFVSYHNISPDLHQLDIVVGNQQIYSAPTNFVSSIPLETNQGSENIYTSIKKQYGNF